MIKSTQFSISIIFTISIFYFLGACSMANGISLDNDTGNNTPQLIANYTDIEGDSVRVESSGNTVYTLFLNGSGDGYGNLALRTSTNGGVSFSNPVVMSKGKQSIADYSDMVIHDNSLYLAWYGDGNIRFRASNDGGNSFTNETKLNNPSDVDPFIRLAADGNNVYIISGTESSGKIFLSKSSDNGHKFDTVKIPNVSKNARYPKIAASGNAVYVLWQNDTILSDYNKLLFVKSIDGGNTFGKIIEINDNKINYLNSDGILASGNHVYISWSDQGKIFFRESSDYGNTFGNTTIITDKNPIYDVRMAASGNNVYIAWLSDRHVLLKKSTDAGKTFGNEIHLNVDKEYPEFLSLRTSENSVYVLWENQLSRYTGYKYNPILVVSSNDDGNSFSGISVIANLTKVNDVKPHLSAYGKTAYIMWLNDGGVFFTTYHQPQISGTSYLGGKVTVADVPIADTMVTVYQKIEGHSWYSWTRTDNEGNYAIALPPGKVDVDVTVPQNVDLKPIESQSAIISANENTTLNIAMGYPGKGLLSVAVYTKYIGTDWQGPLAMERHVAWGLGLRVSDDHGNLYSTSKFPIMVDGITGTNIKVCVNGNKFGLSSDCKNVQLDENRMAKAVFRLAEHGKIRGKIIEEATHNPVSNAIATLYFIDDNGSRKWMGDYSINQIFDLSVVKAGTYQVYIVNEKRTMFGTISTNVQDGSEIDVGDVPLYNQESFNKNNGLTVVPYQVTPGNMITVLAHYVNHGNSIKNSTLLLEVPSDTNLVRGSLIVNGKQIDGKISDGYLKVLLDNINSGESVTTTYQLYLSNNTDTSLEISAKIEYTEPNSGNNKNEIIGNAKVEVSPITLDAPVEVATLETTVSGHAIPLSSINVYDGNTSLGTTSVPEGGFWTLPIKLSNTGSYSTHTLRAQMNTGSISLYSNEARVLYDPEKPILTKFCMAQSGGQHICFNPSQGIERSPYVVVFHKPFTYELQFNNPKAVSNVSVLLDGNDGGTANATLGDDGIYRATITPGYNIGSLYVNYDTNGKPAGIVTSFPPPSRLNILGSDPNGFSDTNITVTKNSLEKTDTGYSATIVYPKGTTAHLDLKIDRDVVLVPTGNQIQESNSTGIPMYVLDDSYTETTNKMTYHGVYFIPYKTLPSNIVKLLDEPSSEETGIKETFEVVVETGKTINEAREAYDEAKESIGDPAGKYTEFMEHAQNSQKFANDLMTLWDIASSTTDQEVIDQVIHVGGDVMKDFAVQTIASALSLNDVPSWLESVLNPVKQWADKDIEKKMEEIKKLGQTSTDEEIMKLLTNHMKQKHAGHKLAEFHWTFDPSGYIYEALPNNRLQNVTATIMQLDHTGKWSIWDSKGYGQVNPEITDSEGRYGWDVPEADWQVTYQKDGYQLAKSQIMHVPPPRTGVNIGLISVEPPKVISIGAITETNGSSITVLFDKYMHSTSFTDSAITLFADSSMTQKIEGKIIPVNPQNDENGISLTRQVVFLPMRSLVIGNNYTLVINHLVQGYSNVTMKNDYAATITPTTAPQYSLEVKPGDSSSFRLGQSIYMTTTTTNALSYKTTFTWYGPGDTEMYSETMDSVSGKTESSKFVPTKEGNWNVVANFTDGNTVFKTLSSSFTVTGNVVPEFPTVTTFILLISIISTIGFTIITKRKGLFFGKL